MNYVYKQLTKTLRKNWIFLLIMLLISGFTSFLYFFVRFSIDGNWNILQKQTALTENFLVYQNALASNRILAGNGLIVFLFLGSMVFVMFFYRFFKAETKQLGCLKALGISDGMLIGYFITVAAIISVCGGILGLAGGYLCSDVLINGNEKSYLVSGLVKSIEGSTFLIGFFLPAAVFCFCTYVTCGVFAGKEASLLISGAGGRNRRSAVLMLADRVSRVFPESLRLPVRLALRKPVALVFLFLSVGTVLVMFVMAYSLNLSSGKLYRSQLEGRNYLYDTVFDEVLTGNESLSGMEPYLLAPGTLELDGKEISQSFVGAEFTGGMLELMDVKGNRMASPVDNSAIISEGLGEVYDIDAGDILLVIVGDQRIEVRVSGIASNGSIHCIYLSKSYLEALLSLPEGAYNGIWSVGPLDSGGHEMTREDQIEILERGAVSNESSAVINQVIGCVVGILFLYLALLMNFQDSAKDILILDRMGYEAKEIGVMLIDIYRPVMCLACFISIWPGIWLVKYILRSLSIQIGDYILFQTNIFVLAGVFVVLNVVYSLVQLTFVGAVRRAVK